LTHDKPSHAETLVEAGWLGRKQAEDFNSLKEIKIEPDHDPEMLTGADVKLFKTVC
jgi:3-hydroxybutyryl-CoA dehydrogenase